MSFWHVRTLACEVLNRLFACHLSTSLGPYPSNQTDERLTPPHNPKTASSEGVYSILGLHTCRPERKHFTGRLGGGAPTGYSDGPIDARNSKPVALALDATTSTASRIREHADWASIRNMPVRDPELASAVKASTAAQNEPVQAHLGLSVMRDLRLEICRAHSLLELL